MKWKYAAGQTPLSEAEMSGLRIKSISTHGELDEFEQLNIEKAIEWTIRTRFTRERLLAEDFIKELHTRMFSDVWAWAGSFRTSEKNIGITWPLIGIELRKLLDDANHWISNQVYQPDELALRFKHKIVKIHCFPNGNGRHSRIMADLIISSIFNEEVFSWNKSNLVRASEIRSNYILALREADEGNIEPLLQFARD